MSSAQLEQMIGRGALLLDFDGPVCSVFSGYPAPQVAAELVALLTKLEVEVPTDIVLESDPMVILSWADTIEPRSSMIAVEEALCAAEMAAVEVAEETPFARELIKLSSARHVPIAIVSNNSAPAIQKFLADRKLAAQIHAVIGREFAAPTQMKPNPSPIFKAIKAVKVSPNSCTLVGDSASDIVAAKAAGVRVIGYANQSWKIDAFASADAVVTSMSELAEILR